MKIQLECRQCQGESSVLFVEDLRASGWVIKTDRIGVDFHYIGTCPFCIANTKEKDIITINLNDSNVASSLSKEKLDKLRELIK